MTGLQFLFSFFIFFTIFHWEVDCACKPNRRVEEKAAESPLSFLVYVDNGNCKCDLQRTNFRLREGTWTSVPPEEIVPGECVVFGSQSFAGANATTAGLVGYACGRNELTINWDNWDEINRGSILYPPEIFKIRQRIDGHYNTVYTVIVESCST